MKLFVWIGILATTSASAQIAIIGDHLSKVMTKINSGESIRISSEHKYARKFIEKFLKDMEADKKSFQAAAPVAKYNGQPPVTRILMSISDNPKSRQNKSKVSNELLFRKSKDGKTGYLASEAGAKIGLVEHFDLEKLKAAVGREISYLDRTYDISKLPANCCTVVEKPEHKLSDRYHALQQLQILLSGKSKTGNVSNGEVEDAARLLIHRPEWHRDHDLLAGNPTALNPWRKDQPMPFVNKLAKDNTFLNQPNWNQFLQQTWKSAQQ